MGAVRLICFSSNDSAVKWDVFPDAIKPLPYRYYRMAELIRGPGYTLWQERVTGAGQVETNTAFGQTVEVVSVGSADTVWLPPSGNVPAELAAAARSGQRVSRLVSELAELTRALPHPSVAGLSALGQP